MKELEIIRKEMNELKASMEGQKKLLITKKKTSREASTQLTPDNNREGDEREASSRPVAKRFSRFKGFFISSKSIRLGKRKHLYTEISPKEPGLNREGEPSSSEVHGVSSPSGEKVTYNISQKETRIKKGMMLGGPSGDGYQDYDQEHNKMTDRQHSLECEGVQEGSSGVVQVTGSPGNRTRRCHSKSEAITEYSVTTDSYQSLSYDGVSQHNPGYFLNCGSAHGTGNSRTYFSNQVRWLEHEPRKELYPLRWKSYPLLRRSKGILDPYNSEIKIELQPKSQKQEEGSEVIFEFKVREKEKFFYQWFKDGAEMLGKSDATLILGHVELHQFGYYRCRVWSQENFEINCESQRAWLDVVPKVQEEQRLKMLREVETLTCYEIASCLDKPVQRGLGGYKKVAARFGMDENMIGTLGTRDSAGQEVIEFLKATVPDLSVYTLFKELKGDKIRRFDIAKILENHLKVKSESDA